MALKGRETRHKILASGLSIVLFCVSSGSYLLDKNGFPERVLCYGESLFCSFISLNSNVRTNMPSSR